MVRTKEGKTESDITWHYDIRRTPGYQYYHYWFDRKGHRYDNITGHNPEYTFAIGTSEFVADRPPATLPWLLAKAEVFPERRFRAGQRGGANPHHLRYCNPTLKLFDYTLDEQGEYPYFKPGKVSPVPGSHLLRLDFEYVFTNPAVKLHRTGWLHLDPTNFWVVAESAWTEPQMGTEHHTFEFEPGDSGTYRPCRRWHHVQSFLNGITDEETATYEPLPSDLRPEECYLTHYNLPEPIDAPQPQSSSVIGGTPQYVWWLAGAGAFALLALLFRRLNGRRTPAPHTE